MVPTIAEVIKVIDGDTVKLQVHIWPKMTHEVNLRLSGVNPPEKRGKVPKCEKRAGQEATTFTQRWLRDVKTVTIHEVQLGKYAGRVLGTLSKDGQDLGEALMAAGHAKPCSGGKRAPWCAD